VIAGKTRPRNDLLCVEWDVKLYTLTHSSSIRRPYLLTAIGALWLLIFVSITLQGNPDPLNSAFHLTYNMVLNLLRVEEINPEYMLERSFYQFQNYASIPALIDSMY